MRGYDVNRPPSRRVLASVVMALALAACAAPKPDVSRTVSVDDKGREVVNYRICQTGRLPYIEKVVCRYETITQSYCYRSLGHIDCYEQPIPGRTVMGQAR